MENEETSQNLSEILFKPKFHYEETSMISNSGAPLSNQASARMMRLLESDSRWYRPIHAYAWTVLGGNFKDIDLTLSRIAVSENERSRKECYDTVKEYGPGNWIYEFNYTAQQRYIKARDLEEKGDMIHASHNYRMAARYFAIASYPNLRGDVLASDSYLQALRLYKKMFECDKSYGELQVETIKTPEGPVTGFLHIPDKNKVNPCVIVCGSYEQSLTDFYKLYRDTLRPLGLAAMVVEMPGLGVSEKLSLSYNISVVIDAALDHLKNISCIDSTRIALLGARLGGTACIRSAILNSAKVRALTLIEPGVDTMFTRREVLEQLPLCLRSLYANRLNMDASNWDTVVPQMQAFSLKKQGLISFSGKNTVPTRVWLGGASFTSRDDITLLQNTFKDFIAYFHDEDNHVDFMAQSVKDLRLFLKQTLELDNE